MALCKICLRLDFATISQTGVKKFLRLDEGPNLKYYVAQDIDLYTFRNAFIRYHDTLDSLHASAKLCDICRLVQISVEIVFRKNPGLGSSYEFWIGGREGSDGFEVVGFDESRTANPVCELMAAFGFCVERGSQLDHMIDGRVVPASPRSSLVLDQIKGWVQQCREHHKHAKPESVLLPTRVLKIINNAEEVILHDSIGTNGQYAALSHCWGSTQTTTLTHDNIEELRNGIKVCNLPQTFQDAIWLTSQLGIPHLWIDSLCIIQDDLADWGKESARMRDVYGNSHLTIAACRASNSQDGFLGRRLAPSYVPVPFHRNGVSGEVLAFSVPLKYVGDPTKAVDLEDEPLTSRGWTLQERYLSPRTLHFCHSKVCFECDDGFLAEDKSSLASSLLYTPGLSRYHYSVGLTEEQRSHDWRRIVESFSRRKLTMGDDKLPAIGGLAARFSLDYIPRGSVPIPSNRYLAGLWFDGMIRDLCWSIDIYRKNGVRPQKYRAPTWSWASVDGQIDYKSAWVHSINELAVVQEAHVELESPENSFGKVTDGWVCLKALKLRPYRKPTEKSLWVCEDGVVFRIVATWDSEPYQAPEQGKPADLAMGTSELFLIPLGWVDGDLQGRDPGSLLGPLFLIVKAVTHRIQSYAQVPGFQRVGFGTGVWLIDENEGTDRAGLKRLIIEKYAVAKDQGDLESIILI
ncbi:heterokaryon incompatibility protein [Fusarium langsethiae]|uniref:Heterokaryon incompatibility protein n=1 Tax=Fusarium langsethiae TaxID=179993 RepID=A0A0N0DBG9_FUSLA|nr:heterokaryon incompatibility protein [Fusarium langsethiae]GKU06205.1 unnamed protein product [Fusarium langsethiae]